MNDLEYRITMKKHLQAIFDNPHVVNFCMLIIDIAQVWDDLIDKDKNIPDAAINAAFRKALIDIPFNPFYQHNWPQLVPVMNNAILQWQDANVLEKSGDEHSLHMAFMLRASVLQIINYCVYLHYGPERAEEIGPSLRMIYGEDLHAFMKEVQHA